MKKNYLAFIVCSLFSFSAHSQITVDQNDFASAGTDILVSNGLITPTIDITTTGANQTWDFSALTPIIQDTLQFLDVSTTASTYALYFANVGFNPNRANVATASPPIPTIPGFPITITNPFNFYFKNSTAYKQVGIGAEINGFPTPIAFNNKDFVYNFPLNFGDADSSDSDWSIGIPGLGFYGHTQTRVNHADGWGSITTPFGTFSALRIRSEINGRDSVHIDTLGFGFGLGLPPTVEYKWIATGHDIPVLQINTVINFGQETVTSIVYPDSLRLTGIDFISSNTNDFMLFPVPANDIIHVQRRTAMQHIEIINFFGQRILSEEAAGIETSVDISHLPEGIYTLTLKSGKEFYSKRFVKTK